VVEQDRILLRGRVGPKALKVEIAFSERSGVRVAVSTARASSSPKALRSTPAHWG